MYHITSDRNRDQRGEGSAAERVVEGEQQIQGGQQQQKAVEEHHVYEQCTRKEQVIISGKMFQQRWEDHGYTLRLIFYPAVPVLSLYEILHV